MVAVWDEVAVNLIGLWEIKVKNWMFTFNALTCIDPVTNLVELIRIWNKSAAHVAQQFENCWLLRYPSPNRCIFDKDGEFTGEAFQQISMKYTINTVGITTKNPQANRIWENAFDSSWFFESNNVSYNNKDWQTSGSSYWKFTSNGIAYPLLFSKSYNEYPQNVKYIILLHFAEWKK